MSFTEWGVSEGMRSRRISSLTKRTTPGSPISRAAILMAGLTLIRQGPWKATYKDCNELSASSSRDLGTINKTHLNKFNIPMGLEEHVVAARRLQGLAVDMGKTGRSLDKLYNMTRDE